MLSFIFYIIQYIIHILIKLIFSNIYIYSYKIQIYPILLYILLLPINNPLNINSFITICTIYIFKK